MVQSFGPCETELLQDDEQHLEVVVLFVAHHIDELLQCREFFEAPDRCTNVLCHVEAGAIATQQNLLVQALFGVVDPNASVLLAVENAGIQAFQHILLSQHVGPAFVIELVELHSHSGVGGVESCVDPAVHAIPKGTHCGVVGFPLLEHLLSFKHQRGFLLRLFGSAALTY